MGRIYNFENIRFLPFKKRIGNIAVTNFYMDSDGVPKPFQSLTGTVPFSFFEIVKYEPNPYYGRESEFQYIPEKESYMKNEYVYIHASCFVNPESSYMLAHWENIDHDELTPDLKFVGGRPFHLDKEERKVFFELAQIGQEHLEKILHDFYISQQ
jgi:hypothetical protein